MENTTVYPFGTDGNLPASVGVIDDMTTGGADKALSAEQGTIIRPYIMGGFQEQDLTDLTEYDGGLGSSATWYMNGKHLLIRVTPGKTVKLRPTSNDGPYGSFYGWLTSSHSEPVTSSTTILYVSGTSRNWVNDGKTKEVTVPEGAYYICLCTKTGEGTFSWRYWVDTEKSLLLNRSEVVNNVYAGGTDVPLSAEQGKETAKRVYTPIPSGVTKHAFEGGLYNFAKQERHIGTGIVANVESRGFQGGACYGNFLFMFIENNTNCWIYDLANNALVQNVSIAAADRGFVNTCHCNTVNFGQEKYDPEDPFPLVYVSTGYASGDYSGALVYRIVATTVDDVTTYSLSLVQTIKLPKIDGASWTEFVVGVDGNCFVCITSRRLIYRMKMPKLSDGDIILDYANALESYQFTPQEFESSNQNRLYYNGKMYVLSGAAGAGLLIILDLLTRTREAVIDLNAVGITKEPEADFIWNGNLCVVCRNDASVHALYFD